MRAHPPGSGNHTWTRARGFPPDAARPPAGRAGRGAGWRETAWGCGPSPDFRRTAAGAGAQPTIGATIRAKLLRARFSRLFTVPRFVSVISAISS